MPGDDFFGTFDPSRTVKDVMALSLKKMDIDRARQQMDMLAEKWNLEKNTMIDNLTKQRTFRARLSEALAGVGGPDEQGNVKQAPSALDVIRMGLETGGVGVDKALTDLVTLENKNVVPPKLVNYVDPNDPTKSKVVVSGRENPPEGYVTEGVYKAISTANRPSRTGTPSSSSVTEEGGFPIWKDPATMDTLVVKPDGTREKYDPKIHGRELGTNVSQNTGGQKSSGADLTDESVKMEGAKYILTGKLPFTGMSGRGRTDMINAASTIAKENGWTPNMVLRMQSDFRAMDTSMKNQRKNYDMMKGFVINMEAQMDRLEEMYKKVPRSAYRLLNIPLVELRRTVVGSGEEASIKTQLIELGNESGKLSTNSAASVRELSESAQRQWELIHDNKLSFKDIMKVLQTTRRLGRDRLASTEKAMQFTLEGIESLGTQTPPKTTGRIKVDPSKVRLQ